MIFDHIGIFVPSIETGRQHLLSMINIKESSPIFDDPVLNVSVQFLYDNNEICYELIAPFGLKNPIEPVLASQKNILNHIAYRSIEFDKELSRLRDCHCLPLTKPTPAVAFNGKRVAFFLSPLKFVIELVEE